MTKVKSFLIFGIALMGLALFSYMSFSNNTFGKAFVAKQHMVPQPKIYPGDLSQMANPNIESLYKAQDKEVVKRILITEYRLKRDKASRYSNWIVDAYYKTDRYVPIQYIIAVISTESSFKENAKSSINAIGPMQVRPVFWAKMCGDLEDPANNILCGTKILAKYNKDSKVCNGNWKCTFQNYNVGPSNAKKSEYKPAMNRYYSKIDRNTQIIAKSEIVW